MIYKVFQTCITLLEKKYFSFWCPTYSATLQKGSLMNSCVLCYSCTFSARTSRRLLQELWCVFPHVLVDSLQLHFCVMTLDPPSLLILVMAQKKASCIINVCFAGLWISQTAISTCGSLTCQLFFLLHHSCPFDACARCWLIQWWLQM